MENCWKERNQRTNGPVNAHLIYCATMFKYKNKFLQILHSCEIGQGQPRVTIYIYSVELESLMLHAKFEDHMTSGSGEEYLQRFLPYMSMAAILVM